MKQNNGNDLSFDEADWLAHGTRDLFLSFRLFVLVVELLCYRIVRVAAISRCCMVAGEAAMNGCYEVGKEAGISSCFRVA